ncbi:MAG: septum formation protein Maf [Ruminococcus sp.]|nr:septum formation protein Maf [Ruminococcus sp.]MBQ9139494.1 septum formation protein Maf [Ruminococcus sp.]
MNIILASASPRRRELLSVITSDFTAVSIDADETLPENIEALTASEYLAEVKASAAAEKFPDDIVIGCDTTVICGEKILGKPRDKNECRQFMNMLSGCTHQVATGCCIISKDKKTSFTEITDVTFRKLTDEEIEEYISTDEPYDKAGGYGIQGKASLLIEKINGDYFNVVGLPVSRLNQVLKFYTRSK